MQPKGACAAALPKARAKSSNRKLAGHPGQAPTGAFAELVHGEVHEKEAKPSELYIKLLPKLNSVRQS